MFDDYHSASQAEAPSYSLDNEPLDGLEDLDDPEGVYDLGDSHESLLDNLEDPTDEDEIDRRSDPNEVQDVLLAVDIPDDPIGFDDPEAIDPSDLEGSYEERTLKIKKRIKEEKEQKEQETKPNIAKPKKRKSQGKTKSEVLVKPKMYIVVVNPKKPLQPAAGQQDDSEVAA